VSSDSNLFGFPLSTTTNRNEIKITNPFAMIPLGHPELLQSIVHLPNQISYEDNMACIVAAAVDPPTGNELTQQAEEIVKADLNQIKHDEDGRVKRDLIQNRSNMYSAGTIVESVT
jgi:hypothetical protein